MNLTINSEYMKNNVKMKMQTPSYFLRVSTIISLLIIFNVTICLAQNPKLETIDSGGFLKSHWTQDYPYNQLCPRDPVNNYSYSYAGCPAVAMGQILNFLRTTQETRFSDSDDYSHNYAGRNYNIDDDWESLQFPSFPQLNELLDSIDASFQRGERLDDIQAAALIFACGTACTQVYTSEGSGTFAVSQAYEAYQRFGFSKCTLFYDADSTMFATLISNLQEVRANINNVRVVSLMGGDGSAEAIHWRVGDSSGKQIVIEIEKGVAHVYDNPIGVITNAPGFQWHLTNLSNYINLTPVNPPAKEMYEFKVNPIGHGNGFLGLPGDFTPPSRFVRAAFFKSTAPVLATPRETMLQCFHILNNFDIPIGMNFPKNEIPDLPSATQWTSVIDLTNKEVYYKTFYNNAIRKIDLKEIDFATVEYQYHVLDEKDSQEIESLTF